MSTERLDTTKPYGTIAPPWQPARCDRPAWYQQGGGLYDQNMRLIVPDIPLDTQAVAAEEALARAEAEAFAREWADDDAEIRAQEKAAARAREREKKAEVLQKAQASPSVVSPSFHPPEFDRPAAYQLGGVYLDEHGREIVHGVPMDPTALAAAKALEADAEGIPITELIARASTMPFHVFRAASEAILGKACPKSLDQMVAQLRLLARKQPNLRTPRIRAPAT